MTAKNPKQNDVHIVRIFDAPIEKVWKAWTDPEEAKKWWGPKDFTAPYASIDLRVGGKYLLAMRGPKGSEFDKDMYSGGTYKEVIPMEKIVASDHFADEKGNPISPKDMGMPDGDWPDEMVVTTTFEDMGNGKTKLTLHHEGHPVEIADMAMAGWNESLDKFATVIQA